MRVGLIARADKTGLGNQTRNLCYMLKPDKVMVIDSSPFMNDNEQFPHWYDGFNAFGVRGFPTNSQARAFLKGLDVLISCELFYNPLFMTEAKKMGVKTVLQYNWEFLDNLQRPGHPHPDLFLAPSTWNIEEMEKHGLNNVVYLPPPLDFGGFSTARNRNLRGASKTIVHVEGKRAVNDRNGTDIVLEALKHTNKNFQLIIKSQAPPNVMATFDSPDPRVRYDFSNPNDETELYSDGSHGFDFMLLPRKYGGLCLPMNEALSAGVPVVMSDVEPNNYYLPDEWLVKAHRSGDFMARTIIDINEVEPVDLAAKIDEFLDLPEEDLMLRKTEAIEIALNNFSYEKLRPRYEEVLNSL